MNTGTILHIDRLHTRVQPPCFSCFMLGSGSFVLSSPRMIEWLATLSKLGRVRSNVVQ